MTHPSYRWVIVAIGGLMGCVAIGAMFSLAVFLGPMSQDTGWSRASISAAMTLDFIVMGIFGFIWGAMSDRFGPRIVVTIGAVLLGAGLFLASRATSPLMFQLGFGVVVGAAGAAFIAPMIATVTGWFDTQRALAVSLVSAGIGMAPLTLSPLAGWLVTHYDWRTSMAVMGVLAWALLLPVTFFVRRAPDAPAAAAGDTAPAQKAMPSLKKALTSPQFMILGGTFFLCCAAHSGPIFHLVSFATFCGIPTMAAISVYSVEGLAGLGGRVFIGAAADRFGVKKILVAGLFLQALAISAYLHISTLDQFYMTSVVFGVAYGGTMPLYAALAREYFDQRIMGAVFGAATMLSSMGMALGPSVGGWIFDTYNDYTWMYLGAVGLAFGAAAIATAFPPFRSQQTQSAPVAA